MTVNCTSAYQDHSSVMSYRQSGNWQQICSRSKASFIQTEFVDGSDGVRWHVIRPESISESTY